MFYIPLFISHDTKELHLRCLTLNMLRRTLGAGMAGVLGLLKDRGELNGAGSLRAVEWAGRTNDMKPVALQVGAPI